VWCSAAAAPAKLPARDFAQHGEAVGVDQQFS
jgi:hypothetical protein